MKTLLKSLIVAAYLAAFAFLGFLNAGCATKPAPALNASGLASSVALVAPQYAGQAAQLEAILGRSKTAAPASVAGIPEGFERIEIYRYKDAPANPTDFSREILYRKVEMGAVVFEPPSDIPVSLPPTATIDADEATAAAVAEWLDELLKGRE